MAVNSVHSEPAGASGVKDGSYDSHSKPLKTKKRAWVLGLIFPETVSTKQVKIAILLFFTMFGNALTLTMVFSYLPRLTKDFGIDEVHVGKYAGIVASSLFLGRVVGSYFWGALSDRYGRKNILIISSLLLSLFTLLFGFNWNFWWVTCMRFMQGVVNGIVTTAKAAAADISDETNQGALMAVVLGAFDFGLVVGPAIGGFLVLPHEQYPAIFSKDSIFAKYPYLFPNLINFSMIMVSAILICFFFDETQRRKKLKLSEKDPLLEQNGSMVPLKSGSEQNGNVVYRTENHTEGLKCHLHEYEYSWASENFAVFSLRARSGEGREQNASNPLVKQQCGQQVSRSRFRWTSNSCWSWIPWCHAFCTKIRNSSFLKILKIGKLRNTVLLYGFLSFSSIAFNELVPIYAATSRKYHGLSFTTADIGTLLFAQSIPSILGTLFIAPKLEVKIGVRKLMVLALYVFIFGVPMIPCTAVLTNSAALWSAFVPVLIALRMATSFAFLANNIMINNSVEPGLVGAANGVGFLFANLMRTLCPVLAGSLYGWSLQNADLGFPLNYYFVFLLLSFMTLLCLGILVNIPESIGRKKSILEETFEKEGSEQV